MDGRAEIDDILDAALDDLGDDERKVAQRENRSTSQLNTSTARHSTAEGGEGEKLAVFGPMPDQKEIIPNEKEEHLVASLEDMMSQLMKLGEEIGEGDGERGSGDPSVSDADSMRALDDLMKQMSGQLVELQRESEGGKKELRDARKKTSKKYKSAKQSAKEKDYSKSTEGGISPKMSNIGSSSDSGVDRAVSRLLSDMARAPTGGPSDTQDDIPKLPETNNLDSAAVEEMGEEVINSMIEQFGKFQQSGDSDEVVDGMMRQLLSKELMYDPMKQVCERFPRWLAESKDKLSENEYER